MDAWCCSCWWCREWELIDGEQDYSIWIGERGRKREGGANRVHGAHGVCSRSILPLLRVSIWGRARNHHIHRVPDWGARARKGRGERGRRELQLVLCSHWTHTVCICIHVTQHTTNKANNMACCPTRHSKSERDDRSTPINKQLVDGRPED